MDQLNQFLQPINSPVGQPNPFDLALNFDLYNDRNIIGNAKINDIQANKIGAGTIAVAINLGSTSSGSVLLDGANNRIIINDGTTNRIVIGSV